MVTRKYIPWLIWLCITLVAAIYLGYTMIGPDDGKKIFLIGDTTHGHYQIEMACSTCHKDSFGGKDSLQAACMDCHADELEAVDDSHPKTKFTDPRNANRVEILDARYCVTCHQEHNKEITNPMGLTLQGDYCFKCHSDIGDDRPTHKDLAFDSCASSGCHNYHDNTALYEDFLEKHLDEPDTDNNGRVASRNLSPFMQSVAKESIQALTKADMNAPIDALRGKYSRAILRASIEQWASTRHAGAGVNCTDCHRTSKTDPTWIDAPGIAICSDCHDKESAGFLDGRHGMRLKQDLTPMSPGMARLPMKHDSLDRQLGCNSCHASHDYNTQKSAFEQCTTCHNDKHTLAYEGSPHHALWLKEQSGTAEKGKGVSCATCHLPREKITDTGIERVLVQHNQNKNLRPNEKMIRDVCMNCHGLEFSINALADKELVKRNFTGRPSVNIESMDWVRNRVLERSKKHQTATQTTEE